MNNGDIVIYEYKHTSSGKYDVFVGCYYKESDTLHDFYAPQSGDYSTYHSFSTPLTDTNILKIIPREDFFKNCILPNYAEYFL